MMKRIGVDEAYRLYAQCGKSVVTDSRKCQPGTLFVALKGANFNGNEYAGAAIEAGCRYAIVDEEKYADGDRIFLVDNSLKMLQKMALVHRKLWNKTVVGITGTNGKTTTKELTAAVLGKKFNVLYTQGNLNNSIGVPLTVLNLRPGHDVAVIEMGASHPGDIKELVEIACPDMGLITNVGHAHIAGFGSFEKLVDTKCELYDYLRGHGGLIFVNSDDELLDRRTRCERLSHYGSSGADGVCGSVVKASPLLEMRWNERLIKTRLVGAYNLQNVLAAICIGRYFKVDDDDIIDAIESYTPSNARSQYVDTGKNHLIVDAYNANPSSMEAALDNFEQIEAPKKSVVLGDMKELGADTEMEHDKIVKRLKNGSFTHVFLVGDCFRQSVGRIGAPFATFDTVEQLADYIAKQPIEGETFLIKGSNSVHLTRVTSSL